KGGNLAAYAAAFCGRAARPRVEAIYGYDSPGFRGQIARDGNYLALRPRLRAFVPQSSFFGMLFESGAAPEIVKSSASGLFQHDMRSWEVERDRFASGGELTAQSRLAGAIIREWMEKFGESQRQEFVEALYRILCATNATTFVEMGSRWPNAAAGIISGLKNVDAPTKKLMAEILRELFNTARRKIVKGRGSDGDDLEHWNEDLLSEE
ncbi:MAG: DUF2974 domain-containing protein, partial [Treponema sp.]|nr:DUF2974 domain-containing protein [Treponema sp.]